MKVQNLPDKSNEGFSLIEVTIALAITAVALVSLMGMIPQGLATMREAADQAIEARIHQQILGEIQLTPFADSKGGSDSPLDDFHKQERFYDSQGVELLDSQKGDFEHIYTARIHIPQAIGGSFPESVGGASFDGITLPGAKNFNENLRMVVIEVTSLPYIGTGIEWDDPKLRRRIHTYQTTVVKMGQDFVGE
ncbi:Verru_Chthon cassette protein B [Verrucomicrobiales bacterium]|nr:Verru_Chthon cassette protein B [Verrucomicrobiales bacterium]MDC0276064.1 Verru_Chthon cassette protein B [Verrucomicrobiales bacterium]MDC0322354.1 Verru_Chthon cassette protein B [Verrucomicrobiales bacterium]